MGETEDELRISGIARARGHRLIKHETGYTLKSLTSGLETIVIGARGPFTLADAEAFLDQVDVLDDAREAAARPALPTDEGRSLSPLEVADAIASIGRNDGPALLFDLYKAGRLGDGALTATLAGVWSAAEHPERRLGRAMWLLLFREARYPAPLALITVYRGAPPRYARGMAWTTRLSKAEWFAGRWGMSPGRAGAHIYRVDALPEAVLADIDAVQPDGRGEDEIVVDPAMLGKLRRVT